MIRFRRSARMARGRQREAIEWSKRVAELLNRKHPDTELHAFTGRFGQMGRVVWEGDFDDLAALDAYQQKLGEDEEYWQLVSEATDLFIEGSIKDDVLASA